MTSKPEDIKFSFVNTSSLQIISSEEAKEAKIESIIRKEYESIVTETVVIKTPKNTYVQAVFEKNQTSGDITNVGEEII